MQLITPAAIEISAELVNHALNAHKLIVEAVFYQGTSIDLGTGAIKMSSSRTPRMSVRQPTEEEARNGIVYTSRMATPNEEDRA